MVRRLLTLNGLATISVVLYHAAGAGFIAMLAWAHRYRPADFDPFSQVGSAEYYVLRLIEQVVVFTIPAFLFVSGFFAASSAGRSGKFTLRMAWGRIQTLAIPYLVWSAVALALGVLVEGNAYSPQDILINLLTGGFNEVFYYVPLIIQFFLLSTWIVELARRYPVALLIVTGILQLIIQLAALPAYFGLDWPLADALVMAVPKWLFLSRIFWFPLGVVAGLNIARLKDTLEKVRSWLPWVSLALIPLGVLEWELYYQASGLDWLPMRESVLDSLYTLAVIGLILAYSLPGRLEKPLNSVGPRSFGIFLTHVFIVDYTSRLIYRFAPALLDYTILIVVLITFLGLALPLLGMEIVNRSPLRPLYSYLFGK